MVAPGRPSLYVAPPLLFGTGLRAAAGFFPLEVIQRAGDFIGLQPRADFGIFPAFPPIGVAGVEYILLTCFRRIYFLIRFAESVR
jgi:hypothetical protein